MNVSMWIRLLWGPANVRARHSVLVVGVCIGMLMSSVVLADGMAFPTLSATPAEQESVSADAQLAAYWLRDGNWELTISPRFPRDAAAMAWVVPFPVPISASEGSASLFEVLEEITAPLTVYVCRSRSCHCGNDIWAEAAAGGGALSKAEGGVRVWQTGSIGALDFAVVSSIDGESLTEWMSTNEYLVSGEAAPLLEELASEGTYFFVAKLSEDVDPQTAIPPVTFSMGPTPTPVYPLRLTALGAVEAPLELVLWVVTPEDNRWSVYNREFLDVVCHDLLKAHPLVRTVIDDARCVMISGVSYDECTTLEDLGLSLPETFPAELQEMIDGGAMVTRYQGSLTATMMERDLLLIADPPDAPALNYKSNIVVKDDPDCTPDPCPPCSSYNDISTNDTSTDGPLRSCGIAWARQPVPLPMLGLWGVLMVLWRLRRRPAGSGPTSARAKPEKPGEDRT